MMKLKYNPEVSLDDEPLYECLLKLLNQIKLTQGGEALNSTLHRHEKIRCYLLKKQIEKIKAIETRYFDVDGTLVLPVSGFGRIPEK